MQPVHYHRQRRGTHKPFADNFRQTGWKENSQRAENERYGCAVHIRTARYQSEKHKTDIKFAGFYRRQSS